jgi:hypothetical protein
MYMGPPSALFHQHVRLSDAVEIKTCVVLLLVGKFRMFATSTDQSNLSRGRASSFILYFANSGERTTSFSRQFHNKKKQTKQKHLGVVDMKY